MIAEWEEGFYYPFCAMHKKSKNYHILCIFSLPRRGWKLSRAEEILAPGGGPDWNTRPNTMESPADLSWNRWPIQNGISGPLGEDWAAAHNPRTAPGITMIRAINYPSCAMHIIGKKDTSKHFKSLSDLEVSFVMLKKRLP
jgi:hypothetical protein